MSEPAEGKPPLLHIEEQEGTYFFTDPSFRGTRVRAMGYVVMFEGSQGPMFLTKVYGQWGDVAQALANIMASYPGLMEATIAMTNLLLQQRSMQGRG